MDAPFDRDLSPKKTETERRDTQSKTDIVLLGNRFLVLRKYSTTTIEHIYATFGIP